MFSDFCLKYPFSLAISSFFWQNEPHIDKEFGVKKAMDLEQETWVMHVPHYIAEISIFMAIWLFFLAKWTPYWQRIWCKKGNGPRTGNLGDACPWLHSRNILFWKDAVETTASPARGLLKHDVYSLHWVTTALAVETLLILSIYRDRGHGMS